MKQMLQSIVRCVRGEISTKKLIKMGLTVGENFNRQGNCIIDPSHCWLIEIGNNVTLANGVYILAHDASTKNLIDYAKIGKVKIGNNVFIGARSIILPNINIGDNVIIGSGSVVTKDIPSNVVVAGNPAKIISSIADYKNKMFKKTKSDNVFEDDYTLRKNISKKKKEEMKEKLNKSIGFVR